MTKRKRKLFTAIIILGTAVLIITSFATLFIR